MDRLLWRRVNMMIRFFKAMFAVNIAQELRVIVGELQTLAERIESLLTAQDRCSALVAFFNLTSPWHDRGLQGIIKRLESVNWRGQYDPTIEQLQVLQDLFQHSGRSPYGWNRTKPGEVVTEHDVYLGNVFGVWTFSIARFRVGQCEPPVSWGGWSCDYLEGKNTFQVVSDYQARPFVQKNGKAIISAIQALKKVA